GERLVHQCDQCCAIFESCCRVSESRVIDDVVQTDSMHRFGEESVQLQHHQRDVAAVLGPIVADQWIRRVGMAVLWNSAATMDLTDGDVWPDIPCRQP